MERPAPKFLGVKVKSSRVMRDGGPLCTLPSNRTTDPIALHPIKKKEKKKPKKKWTEHPQSGESLPKPQIATYVVF